MMCLSKALTGGVIPMAITSFTQDIYDAFYDEEVNKALFHGHTFTANPVGCVAAITSLEILNTSRMQENISRINKHHLAFAEKLNQLEQVENPRVLGVILAFEIKTESNKDYYGGFRQKLYDFFIENRVILRPVGNTIYVLPPYIITDEQLERVYDVLLLATDLN